MDKIAALETRVQQQRAAVASSERERQAPPPICSLPSLSTTSALVNGHSLVRSFSTTCRHPHRSLVVLPRSRSSRPADSGPFHCRRSYHLHRSCFHQRPSQLHPFPALSHFITRLQVSCCRTLCSTNSPPASQQNSLTPTLPVARTTQPTTRPTPPRPTAHHPTPVSRQTSLRCGRW